MTIYTTNRVRFASGDDVLVGDLHRPVETSESFNGAVVVVTGSWTTSKEQQADFYARRLAAAGINSLTFDFRGFGQSQGQPRDWENPARKIADINAAITYLTGRGDVDPDRIGAVGVCASSGYQAANAADDPRVRSLVMIAPWLHNPELVAPYYGGPEGVAERIAASRRARVAYETDGVQEFISAVSTTNPAAAMFGPYDYYLDPERGAIPEWDARLAVMSWEPWLTFDAISSASRIDIPVQSIHSRAAAVPDGAELFHERLQGPSELTWIEGGQLDFYDQPAQVATSLELALAHFHNTL